VFSIGSGKLAAQLTENECSLPENDAESTGLKMTLGFLHALFNFARFGIFSTWCRADELHY
jgi:hypothetical protein